ncbi:MAG: serine/threonine protein kinase [Mariniblastus sp.]
MNDFRCYTRQELKSFILGNLPEEQTDQISTHLDQCNACEDTIVSLENTADNLVELLKGSTNGNHKIHQSPYDNNNDFQRAFVRSQDVFQDPVPLPSRSIDDSHYEQRQIGDYEIVSVLARGGMGSVFKARHTRLEKIVALKLLPERKMQNPEAIARFSREMKIIGQMSHPSMVSATDAGAENGVHYLAMEIVDGVDLGKIVRRCGPLSVANACELVRQAAIGIQYAHEQGVIHRDVKPSNLMLSRDAIVKVLDLGLATLGGLHSAIDELTTVGQLMGTLDYMAPEQCGNSQDIDARTDIYGLGATLYKLLCGVAPYSSAENNTALKKLKAMAISEPIPVSDRTAKVPPKLVAIIDRCLSREQENRFGSAAELASELETFCYDYDFVSLLDKAEAAITNEVDQTPSAYNHLKSRSNSEHTARPGNSPKASRETLSKTGPNRDWGGFVKSAIALAVAGLICWSGIVLYINTSTGQLVVETEVDDVTVTVLKNKKPTTELQVEHGSEATRLYAGEYQIVIKGDSDSLMIDNDRFSLKRGEKVVARIRKKSQKNESASSMMTSDTGSAKTETSSDQITYMGLGLESIVKDFTQINGPIREQQKHILSVMAAKTSEEEKYRVAKLFIQAHKNEIAGQVHSNLISSLAPLCKSQNVFDTVFEYTLDTIKTTTEGTTSVVSPASPISLIKHLETENPQGVLDKMQELIKSNVPWKRSLAVAWASSRESSGGARLDETWKLPLIAAFKDTNDPQNAISVGRALIDHFIDDPRVVETVLSQIDNEAYLKLYLETMPVLLKASPEDSTLPEKIFDWVENRTFSIEEISIFAMKMEESGLPMLMKQMESNLELESWGTVVFNETKNQLPKQIVLPRKYSSRLYSMRQALIREIGNSYRTNPESELRVNVRGGGLSGGTVRKKIQISNEKRDSLVKILRSQFKFEFKNLTPLARNALFAETDYVLQQLLGSNKLHDGYTLEHWLQVFLDADSSDQAYGSDWSRGLRGIVALQDQSKNPKGMVLAVVPRFRVLSFDTVDETDERSNAAVAIGLFPRAGTRNIRNKAVFRDLTIQLLDNLDSFQTGDYPYLLWVIRRIGNLDTENTFAFSKIRDRVSPLLFDAAMQPDDNVQRRSLALALSLFVYDDDFLGYLSKSFNPKLSVEQRSKNLARTEPELLETMQIYLSQSGGATFMFPFLRTLEKPSHIAKAIWMNRRFHRIEFEPFYARILAENPKCLHEVHQTFDYDLWTGQTSLPQTPTEKTLFEQIVDELDLATQRDTELFAPSRAKTEEIAKHFKKAVEALRDLQSKTKGATKRKLDRILNRISNQAEKVEENN